MVLRMSRVAVGKASWVAWLMAVVALWATVAFAGVNEDLMQAAERGDLPKVKRLLAKGAKVNAKSNPGDTALMFATEAGHRELRELLIQAGAK
jgi:hypothetical protein